MKTLKSGRVIVDDDFIKPKGVVLNICSKHGYVKMYCVIKKSGRRIFQSKGYLHRYIMNAQLGEIIDHIDGNKLNNQRSNLRICTQSQNCANRTAKGYSFNKRDKRWFSRIEVNHKKIYLGTFNTEAEAKEAYNQAKIKYFGEFAKI